jgi:hypothetical protein
MPASRRIAVLHEGIATVQIADFGEPFSGEHQRSARAIADSKRTSANLSARPFLVRPDSLDFAAGFEVAVLFRLHHGFRRPVVSRPGRSARRRQKISAVASMRLPIRLIGYGRTARHGRR